MLAVYGEVQIRNIVSAYNYYYVIVNQDGLLLFLSLDILVLQFAFLREGGSVVVCFIMHLFLFGFL